MKHASSSMKHDYGLLRVKGPKHRSPANTLMYGKSMKTLKKMHYHTLFGKKRAADEKD